LNRDSVDSPPLCQAGPDLSQAFPDGAGIAAHRAAGTREQTD
jgi:hypothetical protein